MEGKSNRINIGGLWRNKTANGLNYLSGKLLRGSRLLVFPNGYKKAGDNSPDYFMYLVPDEEKEGSSPDALLQPEYRRPAPAPVQQDGQEFYDPFGE